MENPTPSEPEKTPKKGRVNIWCVAFSTIFLLTTGKWLLVGNDTGEFLNGYLLAMAAWLVASIQSIYTKLPEKESASEEIQEA